MGLIPEEVIQQVIERTDIVELISSSVTLKPNGRNFKANCPFHNEKTPSFIVTPQKQIFHCFGCGVGGNVISFVMKHDHLAFPEAVRLLAQKANISIPEDPVASDSRQPDREGILKINEHAVEFFHHQLLTGKNPGAGQAREYLKERGVTLDTVRRFKIGYAPDSWDELLRALSQRNISLQRMEQAGLIVPRQSGEGFYDRFRNRIMFPVSDTRSRYRAFGGRALDASQGAKYINSPETLVYTKGHHLYGLDESRLAIAREDVVIIVEGYMDCVMPFQVGVENIVASLGTALTVDQIRLIKRFTRNVVMLFDADSAGQSAMMRSFDDLIREGMEVRIARLEQGMDPDSYIRSHGVDAFREQVTQAVSVFDFTLDHLRTKFDDNTVEGRAGISDRMLSLILTHSNEVIKAGYVERLSGELRVPQFALFDELKKKENKMPRTQKDVSPGPIPSLDRHRVVERNLLRLLLMEEGLIPITQQELRPDDFQDARIRSVISALYQQYSAEKQFHAGHFINTFDDAQTQTMLSELMSDESMMIGDPQKMHRDCLNRMKQDRRKMLQQTLIQKIQAAEKAGDQQTLEQLQGEFNQLIKG